MRCVCIFEKESKYIHILLNHNIKLYISIYIVQLARELKKNPGNNKNALYWINLIHISENRWATNTVYMNVYINALLRSHGCCHIEFVKKH